MYTAESQSTSKAYDSIDMTYMQMCNNTLVLKLCRRVSADIMQDICKF